jgi:hypothetical protein
VAGLLITDGNGNIVGVTRDVTPPPLTLTLDTTNQIPIVNTGSNGTQVSTTGVSSVGASTNLSMLEADALDVFANPTQHIFAVIVIGIILWIIWKHVK